MSLQYRIEGSDLQYVEMTLAPGESAVGEPGSMMYAGSNRLHGIVNTGKTPLLFYFYKWQA